MIRTHFSIVFGVGVVTARAVSVSRRIGADVPWARRVHSHARTQAAVQRASFPRRPASQHWPIALGAYYRRWTRAARYIISVNTVAIVAIVIKLKLQ